PRGGEAVEGSEPARVAQPELHRMLADVAVAAEDLHGVVGDVQGRLAGVLLHEDGLARRRTAGIELPGGLPGEEPHRVDLDRHVGELEGDRLLLRDGDAEGAPLLGVVTGVVEGGSGDPDRKSTRLNSSHVAISYAVFCLKK